MNIGERLRGLREAKNLSQGDIENRTGLIRCYTSRVENGHTVPAIETLEKYARALEVPLYQLFYSHEEAPEAPQFHKGLSRQDAKTLERLRTRLARMDEGDRELLLSVAKRMARPISRRLKI